MVKYRYNMDGSLFGKAYFDECSKIDCTICKSIAQYFTWEGRSKMIDNLASGNLKRHLASGRHWKEVGFFDAGTNKFYPY